MADNKAFLGSLFVSIPEVTGHVPLAYIFFVAKVLDTLASPAYPAAGSSIRTIRILRAVPFTPYDLMTCKKITDWVACNMELISKLEPIL